MGPIPQETVPHSPYNIIPVPSYTDGRCACRTVPRFTAKGNLESIKAPADNIEKGRKSCNCLTYALLSAERQGFEPWVPVRVQRFSRPPRSTTPAPLLVVSACFLALATAKLVIIFVTAQFLSVFFIDTRYYTAYSLSRIRHQRRYSVLYPDIRVFCDLLAQFHDYIPAGISL